MMRRNSKWFQNLVSDCKNESDDKNDQNFLDEDVNDKIEVNPKTTINNKVVHAMKKLWALYNDDANEIIQQAAQEKSNIENMNFLIDLAIVANNTKPTPEETLRFN